LYKTEKSILSAAASLSLIQMPVFLALYWVLQASVEMRGAPRGMGWIHDLTAPDRCISCRWCMRYRVHPDKLNPAPADPVQAKMMMFMPTFSLCSSSSVRPGACTG